MHRSDQQLVPAPSSRGAELLSRGIPAAFPRGLGAARGVLARALTGVTVALALLVAASPQASAQTMRPDLLPDFLQSPGRVVVIPTSGTWERRVPPTPGQPVANLGVAIERVDVRCAIRDAVATTTLELTLRNHGRARAEAIVLLPLPYEAVVGSFEYDGLSSSTEGVARLLSRDEARDIYDRIVAQVRDPALLEFAGWNMVRSSVFPIEPGQQQRVRLRYDHVLDVDGDRIDLVLPRSEMVRAMAPWSIAIDIEPATDRSRPIRDVYSPTHEIRTERRGPASLRISLGERDLAARGPVRLAILRAPADSREQLAASLMLEPDPAAGGGYFLLLGGASFSKDGLHQVGPRELTLVIDRSGSMAGEKIKQAREAGLALLEKLAPGDFVNVIEYSTTVTALFERPMPAQGESLARARRAIESLAPGGGTNIHDALVEALNQPAADARVRTVMLLTDGLPTVGRTVESDIRAAVEKGNAQSRRVHVLGVGHDVNAPLLDRIGDVTRGSTTYVQPGDSIVDAARRLARRLDGPAVTDLALRVADAVTAGGSVPIRIVDVLPVHLPDLHGEEQLVILGRYLTDRVTPIQGATLELTGRIGDALVTARAELDPQRASVRNAYVGRLWGSRQVALLADEVRRLTAPGAAVPQGDPRLRELTDAILAIALRWGILTEYTSFLAVEGVDLGRSVALQESCSDSTWNLAAQTRSGIGGVAQSLNYQERKLQSKVNLDNRFHDAVTMQSADFEGVCQVADRGLFKRGDRWIDGNLVVSERELVPDLIVEFGSPEHAALIQVLARQNRQSLAAVAGDVLLLVDGKTVLIRNSGC